ncbi:hypothetical protein OH76DRAFT_1404033 [Lentinus brumalis]|uniref:Transmembrane protein n=1 Tax=Lentinus brumalis TaxID=2498619 RepID=A0A371D9B9_9APHY|nr:hypothetical protein OH76DRAFT_1404033 [Polyporus brumalis]
MGEVYTMTIDDASSIVNYHPQGDGGIGDFTANGWQPFYTGSPGGFTTRGGEAALGDSMHITAFPNATLDFQFFGNSVSLVGIANCSYTVSVDGNSRSFKPQRGPSSATLFSQDGLTEGTHTVSLTANASHANEFAFQRADVSRTIAAGAQVPTPRVYQATNTSVLQYSGNWTILNDPLIPNMQHPAPYYEVENAPASFSFAFQGTGVAINGSRNWGSYGYDVSLDGQGPVTYNASTMWFIGDALLYYQDGLDPTATHTVTVQPTVGAGLKFWLNTVTVFTDNPSEAGGLVSTPSPTSSSSDHPKTNVGAIAGGVIGGLAFLALVAGLLWYFVRRKRQATKIFDREQPSPFVATRTPTTATTTGNSPMSERSPYTPRGDTKLPILPNSSVPVLSTLSSSSPPSEAAQTLSDSPLLHQPSSAAHTASPTVTSPAESNPDPNVAVDRIIHLLAERIATHPAPHPAYESDVPPPEYGA